VPAEKLILVGTQINIIYLFYFMFYVMQQEVEPQYCVGFAQKPQPNLRFSLTEQYWVEPSFVSP
jgi:hypothetical protein